MAKSIQLLSDIATEADSLIKLQEKYWNYKEIIVLDQLKAQRKKLKDMLDQLNDRGQYAQTLR